MGAPYPNLIQTICESLAMLDGWIKTGSLFSLSSLSFSRRTFTNSLSGSIRKPPPPPSHVDERG